MGHDIAGFYSDRWFILPYFFYAFPETYFPVTGFNFTVTRDIEFR